MPLGVEPGDPGTRIILYWSPVSKKGSRGIECSMIMNQQHYIRKIIGRINFQCSLGESNFQLLFNSLYCLARN